ncbi:PLD nuclease N-terminal domain-containing protein [Paracoccus sp. SCSIO 75233]|nr:PLD nuclease N-terminal domain-containing protein [Paracoccus sp. SCSIO 75233]WBU52898.1 PLD nuclease N-terminal domain-containing protein [Paracoccus sp. SCSIO 75233]
MFSGIIGLIIFALDVWAIAQIINSGADRNMKIIWVLVVAILPVIGLIAWYLAGPKSNLG